MKKAMAILITLALLAALPGGFALADAYGADFAGYPIQTDETLTMWIQDGPEKNEEYTDYNEWPFFHYLEEGSGVKVEYSSPVAGADSTQAFNLLLASDRLPDIVYANGLPGKCENLLGDGYMRTLDEYMPTYAPTFYGYLKEHPLTEKSVKTDSGHYYAFPFLREDVAYLGTYVGMSVHGKLLEQLGMEIPTTIADWDAYLHGVKDLCDVPIGGNSLSRIRGLFSNAYGFNGMDTYYVEDGKVKTWMNAEGYRDMMALLSGWMTDGLIDPDIVTIDSNTFYQKMVAQVYGACWKGSGAVQGYYEGVSERDGGFFYEAAPYPVMNEGDEIRYIQGEAAWSGMGAFVSTSCEKVELALRWLDFSYTDAGIMIWNYGKEGESYTLDENGLPQYTALITEANEPLREATSRYCGINGNGFSIMQVHFDQIRNPQIATDFVKVWTKGTENSVNYRLSTLTATDAESIELADRENALTTYAGEMFTGFLIGSESLDDYDRYLAQLDSLRIDRVLEIKQAQYDRFNAR